MPTNIPNFPFDPNEIRFLKRSHKTREQGVSLLEAVAWFAGEPHSDAPKCVSPVLARFWVKLNDSWHNEEWQLNPLIPLLAGTASTPDVEIRRALFLADRAVRLLAPLALESIGQPERAEELRAIPEIVDEKSAILAVNIARDVRELAAGAACAAACAAAYAAAYAATYAATHYRDNTNAAYDADATNDIVAAATCAAAYAADAATHSATHSAMPIIEATLEVFRQAIAITDGIERC